MKIMRHCFMLSVVVIASCSCFCIPVFADEISSSVVSITSKVAIPAVNGLGTGIEPTLDSPEDVIEPTLDPLEDVKGPTFNIPENATNPIDSNSILRGSKVVWDETYTNHTGNITKTISKQWLLTDTSEKHLNIYIENKGNTWMRVSILEDSASWGSGGDIVVEDFAPGGSKTYTFKPTDLNYNVTNILQSASCSVLVSNMDYDPISCYCRAVWYD